MFRSTYVFTYVYSILYNLKMRLFIWQALIVRTQSSKIDWIEQLKIPIKCLKDFSRRHLLLVRVVKKD